MTQIALFHSALGVRVTPIDPSLPKDAKNPPAAR